MLTTCPDHLRNTILSRASPLYDDIATSQIRTLRCIHGLFPSLADVPPSEPDRQRAIRHYDELPYYICARRGLERGKGHGWCGRIIISKMRSWWAAKIMHVKNKKKI